jgi:hypothetical protein
LTLRIVDQKHPEIFDMWCWGRTQHVENDEILLTVKEERNILLKIQQCKIDWIGHIWCGNCLLKYANDGMIEGVGRRGRRHKDVLDNLEEKRRYQNLTDGTLDCTLWTVCFGESYRPVTRQVHNERIMTSCKLT